MELELGLKITHKRDDMITSHANLRIAKDYAGPVFLSRETETMFLLITYLKGFRRENIDVDISKDGNRIAINGKRAVQEMVLSGWIMHKKDVELRAFRKVFQIPDGIILDRIKAKFNDQESSLTIFMPKLVKGVRGVEIQELTEIDQGQPQVIQTGPEKHSKGEHEEPIKMDETEAIVQEEIKRREPEVPRILSDQVLTKESFKEVTREGTETKIEKKKESDRVMEQAETTKEVAKVYPEEKPEESKIGNKEETGTVIEKNVVEKTKDVAEAYVEPERSADTKLQEKPEIGGGKELEATTKKAEPPAKTVIYQETAPTKAEEVIGAKDIEHPEEKKPSPSEELPDLKEQQKKQEIPQAEIVEEAKVDEHGHVQDSSEAVPDRVMQQQEVLNLPNHSEKEQSTEAVQESKGQEPERNVQETTNLEPEKEQNQPETEESTQQPKKNEENGKGDSHDEAASEMKEESNEEAKHLEDKQIDKCGLLELEKQKELIKQATKTTNAVSKGSKLCPPFVVAGSAIIVSLIVLVISLIRAKRR